MDANNGGETHSIDAQEPSFLIPKCPDKSRRDEWNEDGVLSLLEVYESKWALRNRAKLKGSDWEDIAHQVSVSCSGTKAFKTPSQCKNKIESMKKRYRSESVLAQQPNSCSLWKFYPRMDNLVKGTTNSPAQDVQNLKKLEADVEMEGQLQNSNRDDDDGSQTLPVNVNANVHASNSHNIEKKASRCTNSDVSEPAGRDYDDHAKQRKRPRNELAKTIRLLARSILDIEHARLEMYKDLERMRVEAEIKRGEMELKRTEIIAKTQLQIVRLFSKSSIKRNKKRYSSSSRTELDDQLPGDRMINEQAGFRKMLHYRLVEHSVSHNRQQEQSWRPPARGDSNRPIVSLEMKPRGRLKLFYLALGMTVAAFTLIFLVIFSGIAVAILLHLLLAVKALRVHRHRHKTRRHSSSSKRSSRFKVSTTLTLEDTPVCTVCLEEIGAPESCRRLHRCHHVFHTKCIDRWLVNSSACPICRLPCLI